MPLPVLLTRPREASAPLAQLLKDAGSIVVVSPLIEIEQVEALPSLADGLLMTSQNAVSAYVALGGPRGLPVWCVGPRTAAAAQKAGLIVQRVAPDAEALAATVPQDAPPLIHLRGSIQRGDLAGDLNARGLTVTSAVLYHQKPRPLSDDAIALLANPTVVPLFSPRTAQLFIAACPPAALEHIVAVAISQAVADVLPVCATVASTPDGQAMQSAILALLNGSAVEGRAGTD